MGVAPLRVEEVDGPKAFLIIKSGGVVTKIPRREKPAGD
jgi:hypothetical protein